MADSPTGPHALLREQITEVGDDDLRNPNPQNRMCDFCGESLALLYCRADSAKLCLSCDRQVHSSNLLFAKHTRWQLCDSCGSSPSSILCSTDNFVLCQNCDWEKHNNHHHTNNLSDSSIHGRRPLEGFTGCPNLAELMAVLGFEDVSDCKALLGGDDGSVGNGGFGDLGDGFEDYLVWDTPSFVSLDDLIVPSDSEHNFQAMGVPPPPKSRNIAAGQYKEEILRQLRELAKLEPYFKDVPGDIEPLMEFQPVIAKERRPSDMSFGFENALDLVNIPSYKNQPTAFKSESDQAEDSNDQDWQGFQSMLFGSYTEENCLVPDKDSDIGGSASHANCDHEGQPHLCVTETLRVLPKVAAREITSQERDCALSRYKEKKKTRRYEKHIRYESRKVRADSRRRINGRFAKMDH